MVISSNFFVFLKKIKNIKLILTDIDGVLTDGGRYFSKNGEELKKFHTRDGMGVNLLLRNDIKSAIVTKEKSSITNSIQLLMIIQNLIGELLVMQIFIGMT